MAITPVRDPFSNASSLIAGGGTALAAGAGDAVEVNGTSINRLDYEGASFAIVARATLTAAKVLLITATVQEADDDGAGSPSAFTDVSADITAADQVVVMTPTMIGAGTVRAIGRVRIKDLSQLKEWVRIQVTPNLDAGATDTCEWMAIFEGAPIVVPATLID